MAYRIWLVIFAGLNFRGIVLMASFINFRGGIFSR